MTTHGIINHSLYFILIIFTTKKKKKETQDNLKIIFSEKQIPLNIPGTSLGHSVEVPYCIAFKLHCY